MKPAPASTPVIREYDGVTIVRRVADPARRRRLVRLLAELLDKPDTPDEGR